LVFKYVYKSKIFGHVEYYEIINAPLFELDLASLRILKLESSTGVVEIESNQYYYSSTVRIFVRVFFSAYGH